MTRSRARRHRVATAAVLAPIAVWLMLGFLSVRGSEIGVTVRAEALFLGMVIGVWCLARGFDARYPAAPGGAVAVRLFAVFIVVGGVMFAINDPLIYARSDGGSWTETILALVGGLIVLGLMVLYRQRSLARPGPVPGARSGTEPTPGAPVPTPGFGPPVIVPAPGPGPSATVPGSRAAPGDGLGFSLPGARFVRRRPHLVASILTLVPLAALEVVVLFITLACGTRRPALEALAVLGFILAPVVLPTAGVLADRSLRQAGPARRTGYAGFAIAAGWMLLGAVAHLIVLTVLAVAAGPSNSNCFN